MKSPLAACLALGTATLAANPTDITAKSDLPRGQGFSREFPADTDIAKNPNVIFADNFEAADFAKWDEFSKQAGILSLTDESKTKPNLGKNSLKITATLGENTGGGLTKWFESADRIFIRFHVMFAEDCDYTHHLVRLRANKSLQGKDKWSGFGQAGLKPAGDERFTTGIEPWGEDGKNPPPGKWNFYTYWQDMKPSGDAKFWGNSFMPAEEPNIPRGTWIAVEFMLKHNTPGQPDGEQAFWIDGELRGHWTGFNWRSSPTLWANSLALESYVTDRWTKNPVNTVFFDNVVIAKDYIGPAAPGF